MVQMQLQSSHGTCLVKKLGGFEPTKSNFVFALAHNLIFLDCITAHYYLNYLFPKLLLLRITEFATTYYYQLLLITTGLLLPVTSSNITTHYFTLKYLLLHHYYLLLRFLLPSY